MSIRKYLCKKFDREDKGYVTIEDITDEILTGEFIIKAIFIGILAICVIMLISIMGDLYNYGYMTDDRSLFDIFSLNNFITGSTISGLIILISVILCKLWGYIKTFKVVICPLKEKQKEEI